MNKLTYFPGCSAHGTSEEFDSTLKLVMRSLDVQLEEIPDWNCCGATSGHVMTENLALALPLRNLILAQELENHLMGIACASCYSRMKCTKAELDADPALAEKINGILPDVGPYTGSVEVKSMLQFLYEEIGPETIQTKVTYPLHGLKVVCYYGCLLTRPKAITRFDSPEYPMSMDRIMEALGATPVPFDFKTECCGASFSISDTEIVHALSAKILDMAKRSDADAIVVACPLCQSNLDMRQPEIARKRHETFDLPVFYFTQLMALAFGYPLRELKPWRHIIPVEPALSLIGVGMPNPTPEKKPAATHTSTGKEDA